MKVQHYTVLFNNFYVHDYILIHDFSLQQVEELLSKLSLDKHRESFKRERIDGSILIELDDEILEKELGMDSKIHRIKLLRVLNGRRAVTALYENT